MPLRRLACYDDTRLPHVRSPPINCALDAFVGVPLDIWHTPCAPVPKPREIHAESVTSHNISRHPFDSRSGHHRQRRDHAGSVRIIEQTDRILIPAYPPADHSAATTQSPAAVLTRSEETCGKRVSAWSRRRPTSACSAEDRPPAPPRGGRRTCWIACRSACARPGATPPRTSPEPAEQGFTRGAGRGVLAKS